MNTEYMNLVKRIAVVADDARKNDLIEWSFHHREVLKRHQLIAAGYTADVLEGTVNTTVHKLEAGNIGGFQQLADLLSEGKVDAIIFFLQSRNSDSFGHEMKSLLHVAEEMEIIIATNMSTAEVVISSSLLDSNAWDHVSTFEEREAV